ncbi:bifunctional hydroxymethylpyrimidine kinase/phosphomethylpyrimidine kinase [Enterobacter hormaechei]
MREPIPAAEREIQADLKTFSALSTPDVRLSPRWWRKTRAVYSRCIALSRICRRTAGFGIQRCRIDTTKIGMLAEADIVEAVAERLKRYQIKNVVLDTVMLAKSGDPLLSAWPSTPCVKSCCRRWR